MEIITNTWMPFVENGDRILTGIFSQLLPGWDLLVWLFLVFGIQKYVHYFRTGRSRFISLFTKERIIWIFLKILISGENLILILIFFNIIFLHRNIRCFHFFKM